MKELSLRGDDPAVSALGERSLKSSNFRKVYRMGDQNLKFLVLRKQVLLVPAAFAVFSTHQGSGPAWYVMAHCPHKKCLGPDNGDINKLIIIMLM
jgi:hypothetical protein